MTAHADRLRAADALLAWAEKERDKMTEELIHADWCLTRADPRDVCNCEAWRTPAPPRPATDAEVAEWAKLADKATPGPWAMYDSFRHLDFVYVDRFGTPDGKRVFWSNKDSGLVGLPVDFEFAARARAAVPAMAARIAADRGRIAELERVLGNSLAVLSKLFWSVPLPTDPWLSTRDAISESDAALSATVSAPGTGEGGQA